MQPEAQINVEFSIGSLKTYKQRWTPCRIWTEKSSPTRLFSKRYIIIIVGTCLGQSTEVLLYFVLVLTADYYLSYSNPNYVL